MNLEFLRRRDNVAFAASAAALLVTCYNIHKRDIPNTLFAAGVSVAALKLGLSFRREKRAIAATKNKPPESPAAVFPPSSILGGEAMQGIVSSEIVHYDVFSLDSQGDPDRTDPAHNLKFASRYQWN